jgi:hypothetical protein
MVFNLLSLSTALFSALAASKVWPGGWTPGNLSEYSSADSNANYSRTIDFLHNDHVEFGNWQWTVRVSEVDANEEALNYFPGARAAYTTYSFAWPGPGTLNDALGREAAQPAARIRTGSCAVLFTLLLPSNVTSKYNDSSSDCASMLGTQCANALQGIVGRVDYKNGQCELSGLSLGPVSSGTCGDTVDVSLSSFAGLATRECR